MMVQSVTQAGMPAAFVSTHQNGTSTVAPAGAVPPKQPQLQDKLDISKQDEDKAGEQSSTPSSVNKVAHQDLQKLRLLKQRDVEVRAHEQAHLSAAGQYAKGGASFTYQKGPDGNSYAVGGEVGIDIGKEKTPEETVKKMQTIKRAALAPANPSPADRQIAAQAGATEARARQELAKEQLQDLAAATLQNHDGTINRITDNSNSALHPAITATTSTLRQRNAAYLAMQSL